jgi:nicotinamidase/pyrazinamidase
MTPSAQQEEIRPQRGDALVIVDVQNDFLPGGSLAVPRGDEIVPVLNRYIAAFAGQSLPIYATRDWHPPRHCSFREQGGPWPPHCVQGTPGAEFSRDLELPPQTEVISKAQTEEKDAYSGFEDTDLAERLRREGVQRLFVGGLATDYCVLNTVRDALSRGFRVALLEDAVRAIDAQPGDGERAKEEMRRLGAQVVSWQDVAG